MSTQVGVHWSREQNDRFVAVAHSESRNREHQADVFLEVVLLLREKIPEFHRYLEFPSCVQEERYRTKLYIGNDVYGRYADWAREFGLEPGAFVGIVLANMLRWHDEYVSEGHLTTKEEIAGLLSERLVIRHAGVNSD